MNLEHDLKSQLHLYDKEEDEHQNSSDQANKIVQMNRKPHSNDILFSLPNEEVDLTRPPFVQSLNSVIGICQYNGIKKEVKMKPDNSETEVVLDKEDPSLSKEIRGIMSLVDQYLSEPYDLRTYNFFLCNWPELCFIAYDKTNGDIIGTVVGKAEIWNDGIVPLNEQEDEFVVNNPSTPTSQPPSVRDALERDIQMIQQKKFKTNNLFEAKESSQDENIQGEGNSNSENEKSIHAEQNIVKNEVMKGYIAMLAVNDKYRKQNIGWNLVCKTVQQMKEIGCSEIYLEAEKKNSIAIRLYEKLGFLKEERLLRYYLSGGDAYRLKLFLD